MNRQLARRLADTVTNEHLNTMFENVRNNFTEWDKVSSVNKGMTKGTGFNILSKGFGKDFDPAKPIHVLAKTNMIREFGEFLPAEALPTPEPKKENTITPVHQNPNFDDFNF